MPDLDLVTADGALRLFTLLHESRPLLLNLGEPGGFEITRCADRVRLIDAKYDGTREPPVIGAVTALSVVLIRPDGYVAWVGDQTQAGFAEALTTWFGPPVAGWGMRIQTSLLIFDQPRGEDCAASEVGPLPGEREGMAT